jgi:gamma-glutamylcysteine synthetase
MDSASIQKRLDLLADSQNEYKTKKEMLQDGLRSDEELITLEDKLKEAKQRMTMHKQALMNEPENKKLQEDLKDLSQEIKDTKQLLGDELVAYFMENNTLEYTSPEGKKHRFAVSAKFVKGNEGEAGNSFGRE